MVEMTNKNVQWWKIAVCALGVLMIVGAVTYALITRAAASSTAPLNSRLVLSTAAINTPDSGGVGELNWVTGLSPRYETYDFIFVVFPGNDELTGKVGQAVKTATEKIGQSGTVVDTMTLSPADPEFQASLDRLAIQKLPAVLLLASTGQGEIVKGDITETKLLQAYLSLQKTCVPGASGCCPK
jgi:hypothetical protein